MYALKNKLKLKSGNRVTLIAEPTRTVKHQVIFFNMFFCVKLNVGKVDTLKFEFFYKFSYLSNFCFFVMYALKHNLKCGNKQRCHIFLAWWLKMWLFFICIFNFRSISENKYFDRKLFSPIFQHRITTTFQNNFQSLHDKR